MRKGRENLGSRKGRGGSVGYLLEKVTVGQNEGGYFSIKENRRQQKLGG